MLLYALLHLSGFEDVSMDEVKNFRQWGSKTPGHPEFGHTAGVEEYQVLVMVLLSGSARPRDCFSFE